MDYKELITVALKDLNAAVDKLTPATSPATPMPRPRFFSIAAGVTWPTVYVNEAPRWREVRAKTGRGYTSISLNWCFGSDVEWILSACGYQPRLILRALRRIQAATAWCEARAEGRRRQAEEILRQQAKAVEALEAEAALEVMGR